MNDRWQYKVVEIPYRLFGNLNEDLQKALDVEGQQGWELVHVQQTMVSDSHRLFFKKPR